jgi:hypothetical protein
MLSPEPRQKIPESSSQETLLPPNPPSRLDFNIVSRTVFSSLLCAEATANISITCGNCKRSWERAWGGIIIGRRAIGSIKALLLRNKLSFTKATLIGLLTICPRCYTELKLDAEFDQKDQILKFQGGYNTPGKIIFRVSHREMEELFFSKVIVLMGMFTTPFRTIGSDGRWKEWNPVRDN